jgi:hypothetical protein
MIIDLGYPSMSSSQGKSRNLRRFPSGMASMTVTARAAENPTGRRDTRIARGDSLVRFPRLQDASAGLPTPCACGTTTGICPQSLRPAASGQHTRVSSAPYSRRPGQSSPDRSRRLPASGSLRICLGRWQYRRDLARAWCATCVTAPGGACLADAGAILEGMSALMAGRSRDALVFTAPQGGPVTDRHFRNRVWYPAVKAAGIRRYAHLRPDAHGKVSSRGRGVMTHQ